MENNSIETHELQNGLSHAELGEVYVSACLSDDPNSLEHYGILGMKWGVRRYQNKDGSLTKAGSKRYSDAVSNAASKVGKAVVSGGKKVGSAVGKAGHAIKDKVSEKHAQRKEEKRVEDLMSKPIRKLTESEYNERMERKLKEKELRSLEKNVRDISDSTMSKGRKFCQDLVTKVAIPAVLDAGQKQLTGFLNKKFGDALGLGEKDTTVISDLLSGKKSFKDLTDKEFNSVSKAGEAVGSFNKNILGKNMDQDNGPSSTIFSDVISGKRKYEDLNDKEAKDFGKMYEGYKSYKKDQGTNVSSTTDSDSGDTVNSQSSASTANNTTQYKTGKSAISGLLGASSKTKSKTNRKNKSKNKNSYTTDDGRTVYTGTVSGTGTSRSKTKTENTGKRSKNNSRTDPIYTTFVDNKTTYSRASSSDQYKLGRTVITGLLEAPND